MLVTVLALVSLTIAGNVPCATVDVESRSGEAISVLATKPPTVEEIKECSTHVFADHGACCLDCRMLLILSHHDRNPIPPVTNWEKTNLQLSYWSLILAIPVLQRYKLLPILQD
jgi:hypothetical protein